MEEKAFVLISAEAGKEKVVYKALEDIEGVTPYIVFGRYDLVAYIKAPDTNKLREIVEKIRKKNVRETVTHVVIKSHESYTEKPEAVPNKSTS